MTRARMREVTRLARVVPLLELLLTALAVTPWDGAWRAPPAAWSRPRCGVFDPFVIGLGHNDGIDLPATVVGSPSPLRSCAGWSGAHPGA